MSERASFIIRLTVKLEAYMFLIIAPLAVYFVSIAGSYHGPDVMYIVRGALMAAPVTLAIGLAARFIWVWPVLGSVLSGPGALRTETLMRIRNRLLYIPRFEGVMVTVRWVTGVTMTALYVLMKTGLFGYVEFVLVMVLAVPVSYTLFYFSSENAVSRLLAENSRLGHVTAGVMSRNRSLYSRTMLIIVSVIIIPVVIFGHLFVLSEADLIQIRNINLHIGLIAALSLMTILVTAYESTLNIRLGMRLTVDVLKKLRDGYLDAELPVVTRDEIGVIGEHINFLAESLRDQHRQNRFLTENLEQKVERRTEELSAAMEELTAANESLKDARDELWGEMELAKKIQTILLPHAPCIQGCEAAVYMAPAKHVGGDYYDIINLPGVDWVIIGDVSGHGVSAGLVMMMAQTTIRTVLRNMPDIDPHRLLELVNDILYENLRMLSEERYMTMTAIALRPDGSFRYAGLHEDILIYRAADGSVEAHETDGVWLGLYLDIRGRVNDQALSMEPGDVMLLFTDGVVNAWRRDAVGGHRTPEEDMFGADALVAMLGKHGGSHPAEILAEIRHALGGYVPDDDATVVILKRRY
jgi:serine phosphatase RsbU (regulator of sigma subunit)